MVGVDPPGGIYTHIIGTDIVRTGPDEFFVLEDNARTPSGVSYMLENRETMLHMFPELFSQIPVREVSSYPANLNRSLSACAPPACDGKPVVAVLTPGIHNSAYFEHSFLADQMGAELVEGHDLRVVDGRIAMRTTRGYTAIDVLYRRVDDDYLDPLNFKPESMLGVPGIFDVYRAGGITIANAPGTGIADDKALYSYMPDIIEFYTGEKPLLNNVPTWRCSEPDQLQYVLDQPGRTGGEGGAWLGRLRHAGRAGGEQERDQGVSRETESAACQLYCAADTGALHRADLHQERPVTPPCRSAAFCADVAGPDRHHTGWPDTRGDDQGVPGGQFQPGRRHQGYLGAGGVTRC